MGKAQDLHSPAACLYAAGQTLPSAMQTQGGSLHFNGLCMTRSLPLRQNSAPRGCLERGDRSTPCSCHPEHLFFLIEALPEEKKKKDRQVRKPKLIHLK